MGLDMYLYQIDRKLTQKEVTYNEEYFDKQSNVQMYKQRISEVDEFKSIKDFVLHSRAEAIKDFKEYLVNPTNENKKKIYNSHQIDFTEVNSLEELIEYNIEQIFKMIKKYKKYIYDFSLLKKPDFELEEELTDVGYWRNNYDLNDYITNEIVPKRLPNDKTEFNCVKLVITLEDVENILYFNDSLLEDLNYIDDDVAHTKDIFEEVLKNTDFKTQTIMYECWY